MAGPLTATVVLARCSKTKKLFGMRCEKRGRDWVRTWAFKINERKAKNEKFEENQVIFGEDAIDPGYPGCPYCADVGVSSCDCGHISCTGEMIDCGDHGEMDCPWCGSSNEYESGAVEASGGGY
jgi:hypothetical protein